MTFELGLIAKKITGSFICYIDGEKHEFANYSEFEASGSGDRFALDAVSAENSKVVLKLKIYTPPTAVESENCKSFF